MKYIRTKDGRIIKHPHPNTEIFTFRYEILKTADTIKELCDEFAATHGHTGSYVHYAKSVFKQATIEDFLEQDFEIYGAIWTNKGLIYVAKMNNKGELELL